MISTQPINGCSQSDHSTKPGYTPQPVGEINHLFPTLYSTSAGIPYNQTTANNAPFIQVNTSDIKPCHQPLSTVPRRHKQNIFNRSAPRCSKMLPLTVTHRQLSPTDICKTTTLFSTVTVRATNTRRTSSCRHYRLLMRRHNPF